MKKLNLKSWEGVKKSVFKPAEVISASKLFGFIYNHSIANGNADKVISW